MTKHVPTTGGSLFERIRALGRLTPSEIKIANYLDQTYPLLALETVSSISERAKVGRATVVRFISRLGYPRFAEFQHSLREGLLAQLQSSVSDQTGEPGKSRSEADYFRQHCDQILLNLQEAGRRNSPETLKTVAEQLAAREGSIYITGYRTSYSIAYMFSLQLSYLRDGVVLLDNLGDNLPNLVSRVTPRDLLFAIFQSRYARLTEKTAHWFHDRGCRLILLTDREINPLSDLAEIQLVAPSGGLAVFDSRCASLAILETVMNLIAVHHKDRLSARLEGLETAFEAFETFASWSRRSPANRSD